MSIQKYENIDISTQTYLWICFMGQTGRLGEDSSRRLVLRWVLGDIGASYYYISSRKREVKHPQTLKAERATTTSLSSSIYTWYPGILRLAIFDSFSCGTMSYISIGVDPHHI